MKSLLYLCICCLLSIPLLGQQNAPFTQNRNIPPDLYRLKNTHTLNIGVGFPNKIGLSIKALELFGVVNDGKTTPQFTIAYEYGIDEATGIGVHFGYYSAQTPGVNEILNNLNLNLDDLEDLGLPTDLDNLAISDLLGTLDEGSGELGDILGDFLGEFVDVTELLTDELCDILPFGCGAVQDIQGVVGDAIEGGLDLQIFSISGRLAYHYPISSRFELYASTTAGINIIRQRKVAVDHQGIEQRINNVLQIPSFVYYAKAGGRIKITDVFGVYGEFGYGNVTLANLGVSLKFNE